MMGQARRRVPPIPGVRDLITAMDFALAAVANPKERSPEFVAWRDEVLKVVAECELAISRAGKAEDIEGLHERALAHALDADTAVGKAKAQAGAIVDKAKATAKGMKTRADNEFDARTLGLDNRKTELDDRETAFGIETAKTRNELDKLRKSLEARAAAQTEEDDALKRMRKSISVREARLNEGQKAHAAKAAKLAAALKED